MRCHVCRPITRIFDKEVFKPKPTVVMWFVSILGVRPFLRPEGAIRAFFPTATLTNVRSDSKDKVMSE